MFFWSYDLLKQNNKANLVLIPALLLFSYTSLQFLKNVTDILGGEPLNSSIGDRKSVV